MPKQFAVSLYQSLPLSRRERIAAFIRLCLPHAYHSRAPEALKAFDHRGVTCEMLFQLDPHGSSGFWGIHFKKSPVDCLGRAPALGDGTGAPRVIVPLYGSALRRKHLEAVAPSIDPAAPVIASEGMGNIRSARVP